MLGDLPGDAPGGLGVIMWTLKVEEGGRSIVGEMYQ